MLAGFAQEKDRRNQDGGDVSPANIPAIPEGIDFAIRDHDFLVAAA
jgi:hypothetical protein